MNFRSKLVENVNFAGYAKLRCNSCLSKFRIEPRAMCILSCVRAGHAAVQDAHAHRRVPLVELALPQPDERRGAHDEDVRSTPGRGELVGDGEPSSERDNLYLTPLACARAMGRLRTVTPNEKRRIRRIRTK